MNLEEINQRLEAGEEPTAIANELRISVHSLFKRIVEAGLIKSEPRIEWKSYWDAYKQKQKSAIEIAKELNVTTTTVYNNFAKFGYKRKTRRFLDKDELYVKYKDGASISELADEYQKTHTYIRYIIRLFEA